MLYYFSIESTANKTSKELKLNYRTVLTRFNNYRRRIFQYQENNFRLLSGEIECDESYFGGRRKYLRGRSKANKIIVLGLLERKGKIYTTIVENVKASSLIDEIKIKSEKSSVFYTDKSRVINHYNFLENIFRLIIKKDMLRVKIASMVLSRGLLWKRILVLCQRTITKIS